MPKIKKKRKANENVVGQEQGPKLKQPTLSWNRKDKGLQKRWDDALVDYSADSLASYNQLNSEAFRKLICVANRTIEVKDQTTLSRHVKQKAKKILDKIVALLQREKPYLKSVSFTTDLYIEVFISCDEEGDKNLDNVTDSDDD